MVRTDDTGTNDFTITATGYMDSDIVYLDVKYNYCDENDDFLEPKPEWYVPKKIQIKTKHITKPIRVQTRNRLPFKRP